MALFKVDRASASAKPFEKPGTYTVAVVKAEPAMTNKGDSTVKLIFRSDDGFIASDTFFNKENAWWRLNQLLVACPAITTDEGSEIDLAKTETFNAFLAQFVNQRLQIRLDEETYVKDGETKKTLRVKKYLPAVQGENPF